MLRAGVAAGPTARAATTATATGGDIVAVAVEGAEAEPAELSAVTTERTVSPTSLAWSV